MRADGGKWVTASWYKSNGARNRPRRQVVCEGICPPSAPPPTPPSPPPNPPCNQLAFTSYNPSKQWDTFDIVFGVESLASILNFNSLQGVSDVADYFFCLQDGCYELTIGSNAQPSLEWMFSDPLTEQVVMQGTGEYNNLVCFRVPYPPPSGPSDPPLMPPPLPGADQQTLLSQLGRHATVFRLPKGGVHARRSLSVPSWVVVGWVHEIIVHKEKRKFRKMCRF